MNQLNNFMKDVFLRDDTSMRPFFDMIPFLLLFFVPALAMRVFSEEQKAGTLETLLSLPVKEEIIVLAKFIAVSICFTIAFLLTLSVPISLFFLGKVTVGLLLCQYLGAFFLTILFLSITQFFSLFSKNQVVVFLISVVVIFLLFIPTILNDSLFIISPIYYYEQFQRGLLDTRALIYFTVLTTLLQVAAIKKLKRL